MCDLYIMPFEHIELNDGSKIPSIAYGSSGIPLDQTPDQIDMAIDVGFEHIDTAQGKSHIHQNNSDSSLYSAYRNELETGKGIKASGLSRKEIWVTTKWSNIDNKKPRQSCEESLDKLGLEYVDLYLIHNARFVKGDIPGAWKQMEELHKLGYAKTIGVSK